VTTNVAVKIRLKRLGKIRSPHYRIVVADSRTKRDGRAIEEIGKYHPKNDPSVIEVDSERAQYWLSVGAQPTEAVVALFKRTGDWQSFSGDTSPSGVEPQKERKNKMDAFNAALAASAEEPKSGAISRRAPKESTVEGSPAEAQAAADAGVADAQVAAAPSAAAPSAAAPSAAAPSADAPSAAAPSADAPSADAPSADAPSADAPSADAPSADAPSADVQGADAPSADVQGADAPSADAGVADAGSASVQGASVQGAGVEGADAPNADASTTEN
jgi:small subunit ribosomal protein S16